MQSSAIFVNFILWCIMCGMECIKTQQTGNIVFNDEMIHDILYKCGIFNIHVHKYTCEQTNKEQNIAV